MKDDRFTNLEQDIIRSVGRILSSNEMKDLKKTIHSAMEQVDEVTTRTARKVEEVSRQAQRNYYRPAPPKYTPPQQTAYRAPQSAHQSKTNSASPAIYRNLPVKGATSSALWLAGSIGGIVLGTAMLSIGTILNLIIGAGSALAGFAISASVIAASTISTVFAGKSLGRIGRFKKYLKSLGSHSMYTIKEIAEKSGISMDKVQNDLPKFLKSVSLPFAQLDDQQTCLILDQDTYQQYLTLKENHKKREEEEAARKARLASDPNAAAVEQMKTAGMEYLHKIRLVNDALPEQNISEKLDKLEGTCRKIFQYVEQHPNKLPQIRKLMNYYLPMTLKLVETYEQLENHRMSTAAIEESKAEIHSALDNINLAFENLFDKLLENDLMDLSADISVLETMLAQEGLTGNSNQLR